MGFLDEAVCVPALRAGLDVATRNGGAPGPDGVTVAAFRALGDVALERLRDEVLSGTYRPLPARLVAVPKPGGGNRRIAVGCVRDRVVQHAIAASLSAKLDGTLHRFAYAYRRGRAVREATSAIEAALLNGRTWVLRCDIEEFFDRIAPPILLESLEEATDDAALVTLIGTMLSAGVLSGGEIVDPTVGTPQGCPLSPFLANLYLLRFDHAVEAGGFDMVRYADDICINVRRRVEAENALEVVTRALGRLQLRLNPRKVQIRSLGEGFTFLGIAFSPAGQRPGHRAIRRLETRLTTLVRDGDVLDSEPLLRGWLGYYGSFAGVQLPDAVRERAEHLEAERAQTAQLSARVNGPAPTMPARPGPTLEVSTDAPPTSRWHLAAETLARAGDGEFDGEAALRQSLGIPDASWTPMRDALVRFDGARVAELLAAAGRFGDAAEAARLTPGGADGKEDPSAARDRCEVPQLAPPHAGDAEHLLALLSGAEGCFFRDAADGEHVARTRVTAPLTVQEVRDHLDGRYWLGSYPLLRNACARFGAIRVVVAAKARRGIARGRSGLPAELGRDAMAVVAAMARLGLSPLVSQEPGRGWVVWLLADRPVPAPRLRCVLDAAAKSAGPSPPQVTRETVPAQDSARPDKPGTGVLWPLGLDPRTSQRAWLCSATLEPLPDQLAALRAFRPDAHERIAEAAGVHRHVVVSPRGQPKQRTAAAGRPPDPVALATSPFHDSARARDVYRGCNVLRAIVDKAVRGDGMTNDERFFLADVLSRLGAEGEPALEAVLRHLADYRPGMAARLLQRAYPRPTSCGRIRERMPELTARVGCDCRFRLPPGAYPTPALHAVGAADVPGLADRVHEAAVRGGIARSALAGMNEGHKDLGARAAALCARLSDLRRQARVVERSIAAAESELDTIVGEAGDGAVETPAGTLRRIDGNGGRRFVLEV